MNKFDKTKNKIMYINLKEHLVKELKYLNTMYQQYEIPLLLNWDEIKAEKRVANLQKLVDKLKMKLNNFLDNNLLSYNQWMQHIHQECKKDKKVNKYNNK